MIALEKQSYYREKKGKCFNFFTTVILNHWKQLKRWDSRYDRAIVAIMNRNGLVYPSSACKGEEYEYLD